MLQYNWPEIKLGGSIYKSWQFFFPVEVVLCAGGGPGLCHCWTKDPARLEMRVPTIALASNPTLALPLSPSMS